MLHNCSGSNNAFTSTPHYVPCSALNYFYARHWFLTARNTHTHTQFARHGIIFRNFSSSWRSGVTVNPKSWQITRKTKKTRKISYMGNSNKRGWKFNFSHNSRGRMLHYLFFSFFFLNRTVTNQLLLLLSHSQLVMITIHARTTTTTTTSITITTHTPQLSLASPSPFTHHNYH